MKKTRAQVAAMLREEDRRIDQSSADGIAMNQMPEEGIDPMLLTDPNYQPRRYPLSEEGVDPATITDPHYEDPNEEWQDD